jgi:hypothetical protein
MNTTVLLFCQFSKNLCDELILLLCQVNCCATMVMSLTVLFCSYRGPVLCIQQRSVLPVLFPWLWPWVVAVCSCHRCWLCWCCVWWHCLWQICDQDGRQVASGCSCHQSGEHTLWFFIICCKELKLETVADLDLQKLKAVCSKYDVCDFTQITGFDVYLLLIQIL